MLHTKLHFHSVLHTNFPYFYRCCYTVVCKRLAGASWTGPRPAFRWCLDLHVWPRFRLPNGKRVSPFLAPFFVSLFSLHRRPVPWHASICTHGRPWSREHCVALRCSGSPPRSLAPSPVIYPFSDAPLHVYVAVPTATNALLFSSSSIDGVKY